VAPEQVQQLELEQDEAQAEQGDERQQQQQQRGGDGGNEEQEEQEQQSVGAVARRGAEERGVEQLRLSSAQVRRERRVEHEDPHGEARGNEDAEGGGAGITCGRARQAETVAERRRAVAPGRCGTRCLCT